MTPELSYALALNTSGDAAVLQGIEHKYSLALRTVAMHTSVPCAVDLLFKIAEKHGANLLLVPTYER